MTLSPRTAFVLQLMDKLGAPLVRAGLGHDTPVDDTGVKESQTIAALLAQTIKISITLAQAMNLKPEDGDANAIRVTLAAIAGDLVAESYRATGRIPSDAEGRRIFKGLEAVLTFADNFVPAAEHAGRLSTLEDTPPFFDEVQTTLYTLRVLTPVVEAAARFSFGEPEPKAIQDITGKLLKKASNMTQMFGAQGQNTGSQKLVELMVLKSLSDLYADVHNAQTQELSKRKDDGGARAAPTLDDVWAAFEKRCAMLDILLHRLSDSSLSDGGAARNPTPVPPPQQPTILAAADPQIPPAPPPPSSESGTEEGGAPTNPMAFFKKKQ